MRVLLLIFLLLYTADGFAQSYEGGTTSKTSLKPFHKERNEDKKKSLLAWIKNDPKKTLIGNRCMEEVTQEMGFEYVLQPKGQPGNRSEFGRLVHNFGVKVGLLFKNGPFWKIKLNKKRKECMAKTGDYMG
ncbi:MAG: hypothetical protein ACNS60_01600 [Candidatus Cyclobacteriaceae bacterium M2_1C_046]